VLTVLASFSTIHAKRAIRLLVALSAALTVLGLTAGRAGALPLGTITTVAGTGAAGFGPWPGTGTAGQLSSPAGVAYDTIAGSNVVFIADTANCDVLEENVATQAVSVVVNTLHVCGPPSTPPTAASSASLDHPEGVAVDTGKQLLYIADRDNHGIEVVNLAASPPVLVNFIFLNGASLSLPVDVSVDQASHDLYVADQGLDVIWRIPFGMPETIFAGIPDAPGFNGNGGAATSANLNGPSGVAFVPGGTVFIGDTMNNEVRYVFGGVIHLFLGSPGAVPGFSPDGCSGTCPITAPTVVRVDGGTVFYDEDGPAANLVREVNATALSTVAGEPPPGGTPFPYSGKPASSVALSSPHGLTFVPDGTSADVWFSDTNNNVVDSVTGVAAASIFSSSPSITSANSAFATVGQSATFTITTSGSPTPKIKGHGKLPKGLKFHDNGDGTATISGTPTSTKHKSADGLYPIKVTATFGKGKAKFVATQTWTLRVTG